ncbi:XRE family transcriptional regulator [Maritalea mediterranea]|uniref:XRE family transcriptional regulator n=1 Tax=Maritalea mediterranea TaxID=2909667 RepID=A0ABS9EBP1_9HYPH|nr:XRE family transcriptional regulator [Maritalea mediterranea]MCF4099314.1 XRE family transcriptional regulator [Maritalea mediterranea]
MTEAMPITPEIVTWARERAGYSIESLTSDFRRIAAWEAGDALPSYPQLEKMAEKFKVPVAVFFFPEPPDVPRIEETFRTLGPHQIAEIPPRIRLLLRKAKSFQMSLEELHSGRNPAERLITRDLAFRPTQPIENIAVAVREYLGVTIEQQFEWRNVETALDNWRKALLEVGINVFKDQFRAADFSGFCLYDEEFPIIYVNNTTAKSRQIFTLFHELAHLLFHTSGIDSRDDGFIEQLRGDNQRIEVICNNFAAYFLVPEENFDAALTGLPPTEATASELAQLFSVSRECIFRKLLDKGLVTRVEYETAADRWAKQGHRGSGGDYYRTKISYLGPEYINFAFGKYYQNHINYDELADILDTKPKNLDRLEEYLSRRAP